MHLHYPTPDSEAEPIGPMGCLGRGQMTPKMTGVGVLLVLVGIGGTGCKGCADDHGWDLKEVEAPWDVCEEGRDFVRGLGVLDEDTLQRRPSGKVSEIHEDVGDDGVIERCWLRFYDEKSRMVFSMTDYSPVSGPQSMQWVRQFDERFDGPILYVSGTTGEDLMGEPGWSEYDDGGRIVRSGNASSESRFFYDEAGNRTRQERWEDGELVYFTNFQTDELGRNLVWESDSNGDGEIDRVMTWTYEGDLLVESTEQVLDGQTGEWTVNRETFAYDALGRLARWESDLGDDGNTDYYTVTEWDEDVETIFWDHDADGIFDYREVVVWADFSGNRVRLSIHEDYGNTGEWDRIRLYEHDELGRGLHYRVVDPETGKSMHRQSTIYNP